MLFYGTKSVALLSQYLRQLPPCVSDILINIDNNIDTDNGIDAENDTDDNTDQLRSTAIATLASTTAL